MIANQNIGWGLVLRSLKTSNRCGTQSRTGKWSIFVPGSHIDPIGDRNDVRYDIADNYMYIYIYMYKYLIICTYTIQSYT